MKEKLLVIPYLENRLELSVDLLEKCQPFSTIAWAAANRTAHNSVLNYNIEQHLVLKLVFELWSLIYHRRDDTQVAKHSWIYICSVFRAWITPHSYHFWRTSDTSLTCSWHIWDNSVTVTHSSNIPTTPTQDDTNRTMQAGSSLHPTQKICVNYCSARWAPQGAWHRPGRLRQLDQPDMLAS